MPALFDPVHDAELLRKATKSSWSTDHKLLIHVVAENERTSDQLQELRRTFLKEYKKCPIEAVQKATNLPHQSTYSMALVATLLTREEFAAQSLYLAMAGLGTDERAMIQILAHSTKEEVELIKKTYLRMYSKTLENDIKDDTSGKEKEFFVGLINAPRSHVDMAAAQPEIDRDVKELYIAGQGRWSSDISAFVKIITKHDNEYLAALNLAYGRAYGDTLQRAVEKEISKSVLANGMEAMIMDRADYYASELNRAITGAGTDTDTLTRIIATQRHTMPTICHRYMTKYGKNLRQRLDQEHAVNGTQYGKVLQSMLKVAEATGQGVPTGSSSKPQVSAEPSKPAPTHYPPPTAEPSKPAPSYYPPPPAEHSKPPPNHSGPPPSLPGILYAAPGYPPLEGLSLGDKPGYPPGPAPGGPPPAYPPPGYPPAPYGAPPPGHPPPYGAPPPGAPPPGHPPPFGVPPPGAPPPGYPPPYGAPPRGAPPPGYPPAPFGALPPGAPPPGYPPAPYGAPPPHGPPPGYPPAPYGAPPPAYGAPPPGYPPAPCE
ncbi:hypothetical protein DUNSADRAFT_16012 [Dunaliella salina]|uniref:Annexin n=1 Tax=Dunaliella salina TaxID=3046 RepID=A0ABQ7H1A9_DUNSA|nr:hypothetical protein DUNSADRAFT_16012 [Dunaliella salina]|eukprot:KAF5840638.1 hypothetical protein DUNSADRAFT_16012 [Dunaliella salina]